MKVAYFGLEGTFAHEAARKAFPHARGYVAGEGVENLLELLYSGKVAGGLVPVENSSGGMITDSIDALLAPRFLKSRIRIQEEITMQIRLRLLANAPPARLRVVYSHPVPLNFLTPWLQRRLPKAKRVAVANTAEGALRAASEPDAAAISNESASLLYGLRAARLTLPQQPNQTSFYVLGKRPFSRKPAQRTAFCLGLPNRPGSLVRILSIFAEREINLTRLTSRPLCKRSGSFRPNEYAFWMDLEGTPESPRVADALRAAARAAAFLDIIGAYRLRTLA
ncbi:MAG: ACT domain-containing protein [Verrucomicrobiae bacterium]|nr:ACT domain-containing protein [Verrucomicrobiae bacterium]